MKKAQRSELLHENSVIKKKKEKTIAVAISAGYFIYASMNQHSKGIPYIDKVRAQMNILNKNEMMILLIFLFLKK